MEHWRNVSVRERPTYLDKNQQCHFFPSHFSHGAGLRLNLGLCNEKQTVVMHYILVCGVNDIKDFLDNEICFFY